MNTSRQSGLHTPGLPTDDDAAATPEGGDMESAEAKMRRALGLSGSARQSTGQSSADSTPRAPFSQNRPTANSGAERKRHRFVQDGEVMVEIARPRDRAAEAGDSGRADIAETQMRRERAARERAEQELRRASATIQDWQTKHAHAEIHVREAQAALAGLTAELQGTSDALRVAQARIAELETPPAEPDPPEFVAALPPPAADLPPRRGRGRPRKVMPATQENLELPAAPPARRPALVKPAREPKPVRWWIKPNKE